MLFSSTDLFTGHMWIVNMFLIGTTIADQACMHFFKRVFLQKTVETIAAFIDVHEIIHDK